jgi:hypothetical protein
VNSIDSFVDRVQHLAADVRRVTGGNVREVWVDQCVYDALTASILKRDGQYLSYWTEEERVTREALYRNGIIEIYGPAGAVRVRVAS